MDEFFWINHCAEKREKVCTLTDQWLELDRLCHCKGSTKERPDISGSSVFGKAVFFSIGG